MRKYSEKKIWDKYEALQQDEAFAFGSYYSYQFRNTPRHILFTLSRYKFALKMIGEGKKILELGCNEGLGSYFMSEFAVSVTGVDFDERAVKWADDNYKSDKLSFICDNFLGKRYGSFDAVVSYDVIEHIYAENEKCYMETVTDNLNPDGIFLVGTPNAEADKYSNKEISGAHVNLYSHDRFYTMLRNYFHNVFPFSQNDEMIHTGFSPMAHYLLALCCYKK